LRSQLVHRAADSEQARRHAEVLAIERDLDRLRELLRDAD
jgi:hypothetical protein